MLIDNFISLSSSLLHQEAKYYKKFPNYTRIAPHALENLYLKIKIIFSRIQASINCRSNLLTDKKIAQYLIAHLTPELLTTCSWDQLNRIKQVCNALLHTQLPSLVTFSSRVDERIALNQAALTIQTALRRHSANAEVSAHIAALTIQTNFRRHLAELEHRKREQEKAAAALTIQTAFRKHLANSEVRKRAAALTIQTAFRRHLADSEVRKRAAVLTLQSSFRAHRAKKLLQIEKEKPLTHRMYDRLRTSSEPIEDGYGEFVIFYSKNPGKPVPEKEYNLAYERIHKERANLNYNSKIVRAIVKAIDPSLEIAFMPRTLFELIYIHTAIEEELKDKQICDLQSEEGCNHFQEIASQIGTESIALKKNKYIEHKLAHCWHTCCFTDKYPGDNRDSTLKLLAFRINNLIVQQLKSTKALTGEQIFKCAEEQLEFFKHHRKVFRKALESNQIKGSCGARGAAINFGDCPGSGGRIYSDPMGIKDDHDAQVVRNAIALECDRSAQNAFVLYRAENLSNDAKISKEELVDTSLSYGTSLFAGAFRDGTATVFYYSKQDRDTFAIVVPFGDKSPFYIRSDNAICQLLSMGEFFHGRSKLPKEALSSDSIAGIYGTKEKVRLKLIPQSLISQKTAEELAKELANYHSKALLLHPVKAR